MTDPQEALEGVVRLSAAGTDSDVCSLYSYDSQSDTLSLAATWGLPARSIGRVMMRRGEGLVGLVIESGGPVKVEDSKVILPEKQQVDFGMESLIHHFKVIMDGHGLTPPLGDSYLPTESPNGELGFHVVSNGTGYAHRMRVRAPSFMNYQAFSQMVEGLLVSDAIAVLGSFNIIAGELDR